MGVGADRYSSGATAEHRLTKEDHPAYLDIARAHLLKENADMEHQIETLKGLTKMYLGKTATPEAVEIFVTQKNTLVANSAQGSTPTPTSATISDATSSGSTSSGFDREAAGRIGRQLPRRPPPRGLLADEKSQSSWSLKKEREELLVCSNTPLSHDKPPFSENFFAAHVLPFLSPAGQDGAFTKLSQTCKSSHFLGPKGRRLLAADSRWSGAGTGDGKRSSIKVPLGILARASRSSGSRPERRRGALSLLFGDGKRAEEIREKHAELLARCREIAQEGRRKTFTTASVANTRLNIRNKVRDEYAPFLTDMVAKLRQSLQMRFGDPRTPYEEIGRVMSALHLESARSGRTQKEPLPLTDYWVRMTSMENEVEDSHRQWATLDLDPPNRKNLDQWREMERVIAETDWHEQPAREHAVHGAVRPGYFGVFQWSAGRYENTRWNVDHPTWVVDPWLALRVNLVYYSRASVAVHSEQGSISFQRRVPKYQMRFDFVFEMTTSGQESRAEKGEMHLRRMTRRRAGGPASGKRGGGSQEQQDGGPIMSSWTSPLASTLLLLARRFVSRHVLSASSSCYWFAFCVLLLLYYTGSGGFGFGFADHGAASWAPFGGYFGASASESSGSALRALAKTRTIGYGILTGCNRFPVIAGQVRSLHQMGVQQEDVYLMLSMCHSNAIYGRTETADCEDLATKATVAQFWSDEELKDGLHLKHLDEKKRADAVAQENHRGGFLSCDGAASGISLRRYEGRTNAEAGAATLMTNPGGGLLSARGSSVGATNEASADGGFHTGAASEMASRVTKIIGKLSGDGALLSQRPAPSAATGTTRSGSSTESSEAGRGAGVTAPATGLTVVEEQATAPREEDLWVVPEPVPEGGKNWKTTTRPPSARVAASLAKERTSGNADGDKAVEAGSGASFASSAASSYLAGAAPGAAETVRGDVKNSDTAAVAEVGPAAEQDQAATPGTRLRVLRHVDHRACFPEYSQRFWGGKQDGFYNVMENAPISHADSWSAPGIHSTHFRVTTFFMWMFGVLFSRYDYAAFIEDDLGLSPYLHTYFLLASKALDMDASLAGASAWHDNQVDTPKDVDGRPVFHVQKQNHFGGLGWMTSRSVFESYILPFMRVDRAHTGWDTIFSFLIDKMLVDPRQSVQRARQMKNDAIGGPPPQVVKPLGGIRAKNNKKSEAVLAACSSTSTLVDGGAGAAESCITGLYKDDLDITSFVGPAYEMVNVDGGKKERLAFLYPSVALTKHLTTSTHISGNDAEYRRLASLGFWPSGIEPLWPRAESLTAWNYEREVLERDILKLRVVERKDTTAGSRGAAATELTSQTNHSPMVIQEKRQTNGFEVAGNVRVHCLVDATSDTDREGWGYMQEKFSMIGVGWGGTPRQSYKGTMMVYVEHLRHFVVARYSPYYALLCSS
eukprot:g8674.t1